MIQHTTTCIEKSLILSSVKNYEIAMTTYTYWFKISVTSVITNMHDIVTIKLIVIGFEKRGNFVHK